VINQPKTNGCRSRQGQPQGFQPAGELQDGQNAAGRGRWASPGQQGLGPQLLSVAIPAPQLNAQQLGIGRLGDASVGGWIRLAIFERLLQQAEAAARPAGRQGLSAAGLGPTRQTTWLL